MHKAVTSFIQDIKAKHPEFFRFSTVLDCGSLDINGSNRPFFADSHYTGIDIVDGKNVDYVTRVHEFNPQKLFHVVISTEMLEHDEYLSRSLARMFELLKPGGLLIITAAGFGRAEHGTVDHHPKDSPMTHNHYQNVEPEQFLTNLPLHEFRAWAISQVDTDIRLYGIKKQP